MVNDVRIGYNDDDDTYYYNMYDNNEVDHDFADDDYYN